MHHKREVAAEAVGVRPEREKYICFNKFNSAGAPLKLRNLFIS
jgi:hypothetical protein